MKNLPPIFKVSNNISSNNTSYYKSSSVAKMPVIKQKEEEEQASIEDKINAIFRTRGYPFNIPVTISFAGKTVKFFKDSVVLCVSGSKNFKLSISSSNKSIRIG